MLERKGSRSLLAFVSIICFSVGASCSDGEGQFTSADRGFMNQTGVALPIGVRAVAHASEVTDNFFHRTHYWILNGPDNSLRGVASAFHLQRSDEDAIRMLPDMKAMFGTLETRADVVEGYEGSLDGKRDRWLIIFANGRGAIFAY